MKRIFFILSCYCVLSFSALNAQHQGSSFAESFANAYHLQSKGEISAAIEIYEDIIKNNTLVSAEVHNNLGLAYLQNNEIGKAVLNLEKAIKYKPSFRDAQHNLLAASIKVKEGTAINRAATGAFLSVNQWSIIALLCSLAIGGSFVFLQEKRKKNIALGALSFIMIIALIFGALANNAHHKEIAVLLQEKVMLKKEPNLTSGDAGMIYEGTSMEILESKDSWYKVLLADGVAAWIPATLVTKIKNKK